MAVLLNRKICDNASECSGIEVCPTGAIFWNSEEKQIGLDNNLCISCKACVDACPVGAFAVADNESDYSKYLAEFEADTRTAKELFVERYGAMPIDEEAVIDVENLDDKLNELGGGLIIVEKFKDESIQCLLHSIPIEPLLKRFNAKYVKCYVSGDVSGTYPQLVIYNNGIPKKTIEGYFEDKDTDALVNRIENAKNN